MSQLILLHEDALRLDHPVFYRADEGAQIAFIWDSDYFAKNHCGLKRQVFIYETLCDMQVDIYHGDFDIVLAALCARDDIDEIFMPASPNPLLKARFDNLPENCETHCVPDEAFVHLDNVPDLRRFFKYWNKAKKAAFKVNGIGA